MITFAPGTEAHALHRSHRAVRMLDRLIRAEQTFDGLTAALPGTTRTERGLQLVRKALAGKPLRAYLRSGKYSKQRRLI